MISKRLALIGAAVAMLAGAFSVHAQDYPVKDKPVTFVVPFAAGGPTDKVARDLAVAMSKTLGANIVVDNAAGASGSIGANKVAKAAPDGYTLLVFQLAHHDAQTALQRRK